MRYVKATYIFLQMVLMMLGGIVLSEFIGQVFGFFIFALLVVERGIGAFLVTDEEPEEE